MKVILQAQSPILNKYTHNTINERKPYFYLVQILYLVCRSGFFPTSPLFISLAYEHRSFRKSPEPLKSTCQQAHFIETVVSIEIDQNK